MSVVVITGSGGLVGSEAVRHYAALGKEVIGIDNDMRSVFFGQEASTEWNCQSLEKEFSNFENKNLDIRDKEGIDGLLSGLGKNIELIIHTAAQPSHDWAARDPIMDFTVNANGTLNLLEATRQHSPEAVFIFTSTNKVYGDLPNSLPLIEEEKRWEIDSSHQWHGGIPEEMSIDQSKHSLFGASKVAADILVQEYGRYFGMNTVCFRGGCLTGPMHSGAELHGFLSYLVKCAMTGTTYNIYGYKGKQLRDNIHSADLIAAFDAYAQNPRPGEVYNMGGGRHSNCSMLEAIEMLESITGREFNSRYEEQNRIGDHIWYISSLDKFQSHYPNWKLQYNVEQILQEIYEHNVERWGATTA